MPEMSSKKADLGYFDRDRGASVVEFVAVLPVFLLLLFGLVQFGSIFLVRNQMTQAVSDAARTAVTSPNSAATTAQTALEQDIPRDGAGLLPINCANAALSCNAVVDSTCSPPAGFECLTVTVVYNYTQDPVIDFPFIPAPSKITASSTVLVGNGNLS